MTGAGGARTRARSGSGSSGFSGAWGGGGGAGMGAAALRLVGLGSGSGGSSGGLLVGQSPHNLDNSPVVSNSAEVRFTCVCGCREMGDWGETHVRLTQKFPAPGFLVVVIRKSYELV